MYEKFTERARVILQLARREAGRYRHDYVGVEHLLLGIASEGSNGTGGVGHVVLFNSGADLKNIRAATEKRVLPGTEDDANPGGELPRTPRLKRALEYAWEEACNLDHNYVGTEHLLLGVVRDQESIAYEVLEELGVSATTVRSEIMNLLGHVEKETTSEKARGCVLQDWVHELTMMQQTVLLTAIRGPDGLHKNHVSKVIMRWYRRCILYSAMDGYILQSPYEEGGGSFTGPCRYQGLAPSGSAVTESCQPGTGIDEAFKEFLRSSDEIPLHFFLHVMHAAEILGYKHPVSWIRLWWKKCYVMMAHSFHLYPETEGDMDTRLGDDESAWRAREAVPST